MKHLLKLTVILIMIAPSFAHSKDLLIFGGYGHDVYLGCINCNKFSTDSICNEFGKGSTFISDGLFNEFGSFGSEYFLSSPWNEYSISSSVPIVVDRNGEFYGYFTINTSRLNIVNFAEQLNEIYNVANGDLEKVRDVFCEIAQQLYGGIPKRDENMNKSYFNFDTLRF